MVEAPVKPAFDYPGTVSRLCVEVIDGNKEMARVLAEQLRAFQSNGGLERLYAPYSVPEHNP